jgi:hypothetical protein
VSKDSDFRQLAFLHGPPPKVVWRRVGNASTVEILEVILDHVEVVESFVDSEDEALLALPFSALPRNLARRRVQPTCNIGPNVVSTVGTSTSRLRPNGEYTPVPPSAVGHLIVYPTAATPPNGDLSAQPSDRKA